MKTKTITTIGAALSAAAILCTPSFAEKTAKKVKSPQKTEEKKVATSETDQAKVQIAILLDTSGSMSGLIEQTKTQLWKIINTFISAKQNGKIPYVEVALYEYGKDSLSSETYWIRQIQPLTRDLDEISKQLFALQTNGGSEYCGAVIKRATDDLKWDESNDVYKAIFIAGNEAFTQGPISADQSVKSSISKGVIVNTIHCGDEKAGIAGGWKKGAMLADGKFLTINHNRAVVHIEAPQDAEIMKLNNDLNKTYIAYGRVGASKKREQAAQDVNAKLKFASGASVQRALSKSSLNYYNANWDLVDAAKQKNFDISKVKESELPKELKGMTTTEKKSYIEKKAKARKVIQVKIQGLNKKRSEYVAQKRKKMAEQSGEKTLDEVISETVRVQAKKKGYSFKK